MPFTTCRSLYSKNLVQFESQFPSVTEWMISKNDELTVFIMCSIMITSTLTIHGTGYNNDVSLCLSHVDK